MITLRDRSPAPGWAPLRTTFVPDGSRDGRDINEREASTVVNLVGELIANPSYADMTFGVVTLLGKAQSPRILELLFDRLGPDIIEERDIRVGEPSVFQGDERDVIIISTVVDATGRIGAMNKRSDERRINVAASRAKNQLWIVHSVPPEDFPKDDPRAELIRHCMNPTENESSNALLEQKCESQFERDVLRQILDRGYTRVRAQHEVGRKRIDLVIEGPNASLAIECDGDAWHGPEQWDDDRIRQQKLERAGWTFERIRGSAFYRNPKTALNELWARLDELDIPTGDWAHYPADRFEVQSSHQVINDSPDTSADNGSDIQIPAREPQDHAPIIASVVTDGMGSIGSNVESVVYPDAKGSSANDPQAESGRPENPLYPEPKRKETSSTFVAMADYVLWLPRPCSAVLSGREDRVIEELAEILGFEGPMHSQRLYQLYARASGSHRVGREMRHGYNSILNRALRAKTISSIDDDLPGLIEKTVFITGTPSVLMRELGPRQLQEVPRSEVLTVIGHLGLAGTNREIVKRQVLATYGLARLGSRASEYIDECLNYTWR